MFKCLRDIQAEQSSDESKEQFAKLVSEGVMKPRYEREALQPNHNIAYHIDAFGNPVIHLGIDPTVQRIYDLEKECLVDQPVKDRCVRFMTIKEFDARKLNLPFVRIGEDWVMVGDIL
jgi:hypothetical protein